MAKPILTLPCKYQLSDLEQRGELHHCVSCDHSLKDFRHVPEQEILQALSENAKTCGIFHPSQVAARTSVFPIGLQRRVGLSLLGILGFVAPVVTSCEEGKSAPRLPEEKSQQEREEEAFAKLKFPMNISGHLKNSSNDEPLSMARISVCQGSTVLQTVSSDKDGFFRLNIGKGDLKSTDFDLIIEQIGYETDTVRRLAGMPAWKRTNLLLQLEAYPRPIVTYDNGDGTTSICMESFTLGMMGPPEPEETQIINPATTAGLIDRLQQNDFYEHD